MRSLRILVLIHRQQDSSPYCFYVHEQVKALRARGHDVTVISCVCNPPFAKLTKPSWASIDENTPREAIVDGIKIYYPRCLTLGNIGERIFGGIFMARAALPIAKRLHAEKPIDIVHAHMLPRDGHAGLIISRILEVAMVLTIHGTDILHYFIPGQKPWARNIRIASQTDALLAVSSSLLARVEPYRKTGITRIVQNGVDLSLIPSDSKRVKHSILSVGTLKERKCMDITLEAFSRMASDWPDATLTIIGSGPMERFLNQRIEELEIGNRVFLTGGLPHSEVLRRMSQSDVFVLPSWGEGFGIVYIEAMAAGMIAVGSKGEGIEDIIVDGVNGFLIKAGDVDETELILRRIFENEEGYRTLREAGYKTAIQMTWDKNAEIMESIYTEIRGMR